MSNGFAGAPGAQDCYWDDRGFSLPRQPCGAGSGLGNHAPPAHSLGKYAHYSPALQHSKGGLEGASPTAAVDGNLSGFFQYPAQRTNKHLFFDQKMGRPRQNSYQQGAV